LKHHHKKGGRRTAQEGQTENGVLKVRKGQLKKELEGDAGEQTKKLG